MVNYFNEFCIIECFLPHPALPRGEGKDFVNLLSTYPSPLEKVAEQSEVERGG